MTTHMRHCRCCGEEIKHNGWLDVCDKPECVRKGTYAHAHLTIFPCHTYYGVFLCDTDRDRVFVQAVYFNTEAQAKEFVAHVRAGISKDELAALVEAHKFPSERITVEELRRRADEEF
jgi:hypothetical protein